MDPGPGILSGSGVCHGFDAIRFPGETALSTPNRSVDGSCPPPSPALPRPHHYKYAAEYADVPTTDIGAPGASGHDLQP